MHSVFQHEKSIPLGANFMVEHPLKGWFRGTIHPLYRFLTYVCLLWSIDFTTKPPVCYINMVDVTKNFQQKRSENLGCGKNPIISKMGPKTSYKWRYSPSFRRVSWPEWNPIYFRPFICRAPQTPKFFLRFLGFSRMNPWYSLISR